MSGRLRIPGNHLRLFDQVTPVLLYGNHIIQVIESFNIQLKKGLTSRSIKFYFQPRDRLNSIHFFGDPHKPVILPCRFTQFDEALIIRSGFDRCCRLGDRTHNSGINTLIYRISNDLHRFIQVNRSITRRKYRAKNLFIKARFSAGLFAYGIECLAFSQPGSVIDPPYTVCDIKRSRDPFVAAAQFQSDLAIIFNFNFVSGCICPDVLDIGQINLHFRLAL